MESKYREDWEKEWREKKKKIRIENAQFRIKGANAEVRLLRARLEMVIDVLWEFLNEE